MPRRVISVLFTDIVDSTALFQSLGADRADEVRRAHDRAVIRSVEAAGGTVVKHLGDGIMATFPGPSAACEAAVAAQRSVTRAGTRLGIGLAIRAGISMGEATEEDDDWFGTPVVEAARLCGAAGPGEILLADRAGALAEVPGGTTSVGALQLKGLDAAVAASRVTWADADDDAVPLPAGLRTGARLPFAGRADARRQLDERLAAARTGDGGLVLVAGEPGIGKTRLVAEFAAGAHAAGVTIAYGRCDQSSLFPYQPFAEALRHLHGAGLLPGASGLAALVPEAGGEPPGDPDAAGRQLLDAVGAAVREVATDRPLVLVLDDLHWADTGSLGMLRHLLRDLEATPLLVVGTYRDTDIDRSHPFGALLVELRRAGQTDRIRLEGIDDHDIVALLGTMAGHELGHRATDLARRLASQTSGNPFFLGEVLAHLVETGVLAEQAGRWDATVDLTATGLPEGVRDVVGQRLSRLSPGTEDLLAVLAVNGRPTDLQLLRDVGEGTIDEVVGAIDEAVASGLLVEEASHRGPRYSFSHALVRQTLIEELTAARTLRLHAQLAECLAVRAVAHPDRWLEAIHHAIEGAPLLGFDRAGEILLAGETSVEQLGSPEVVVEIARRFDAVGRALDAGPTVAWADTLSRAALATFLSGDRTDVGDLARRAIEMARALDDPRSFVRAVSAMSQAAAFGLDPEFLGLLPEALERSVTGTRERFHLLVQQLHIATYVGLVDVFAAGEGLLQEATRSGSDEALAGAHGAVAHAGQAGLAATQTLHHADEAWRLAARLAPLDRAYARFTRTYPLIRLGRLVEARANAEALVQEASESRANAYVAAAHQQLSIVDLAEGDLAGALANMDSVRRVAPGEPMLELGRIVHDLWAAHLAGDQHGALAHLDQLGALPYPELLTATGGWLAGEAGDHERAAASARELAAIDLAALPTTWADPGLWMLAGQLAVQQGHRELADRVSPLLSRLAGEQVIYVCNHALGAADEVLAGLDDLRRTP